MIDTSRVIHKSELRGQQFSIGHDTQSSVLNEFRIILTL